MYFKRKIPSIPTVRNQLGISVVPKNEETKNFLTTVSETRVYVKKGMIYRQSPERTELLGTINKAWRELERVSDILR